MSVIAPLKPKGFHLDLPPRALADQKHSSPCADKARIQFKALTGMDCPANVDPQEALRLHDEGRLIIPRDAKIKLQNQKERPIDPHYQEALIRKYEPQARLWSKRLIEVMNQINQVHPFSAKAKNRDVKADVGQAYLSDMENLIRAGRHGAAYIRLQKLYEIEPASSVHAADSKGMTMKRIGDKLKF